jgi:hypothetical protein
MTGEELTESLLREFTHDYMSWKISKIHFPNDMSPKPRLYKPWMDGSNFANGWKLWVVFKEKEIRDSVDLEVGRTYN